MNMKQVFICVLLVPDPNGKPIGKVLGFTGTSKLSMMDLRKEFGQCRCTASHASMNEVDWSETAFYNLKLGRAIVKGAIKAMSQEV